MKTKPADQTLKNQPNLSKKDVLPPELLGKQRECVLIKRPTINNLEEKIDQKVAGSSIGQLFSQWTSGSEIIDLKEGEKMFKEQNYDYLNPDKDQIYVWKKADKFFQLISILKNDQEKTVFLKFQDDSKIFSNKSILKTLSDDTIVNYSKQKIEEKVEFGMCESIEEEENDERYQLRQAEFDKDFKPKPGQKKQILVY